MSTRTVHRGSRGRFAGASNGKAETVKVGSGYARATGGTQVASGVRHKTIGSRASALGRGARKVAANPTTQFVAVVGVAYGAQHLANRSLGLRRNPITQKVTSRSTGAQLTNKGFASATRARPPLGSPGNPRPMKGTRQFAMPAARPKSPNYGSAKGRKDFVGRRVTDGNFGLKLGH